MNKVFTLLLVLLLFYWIIKALLSIFIKKKVKRRAYQVTLTRQVEHLFSAVLLTIIPLSVVTSYYHLFPPTIKIILLSIGSFCLLCALISFYLYFNYIRKTPYQALIYDPHRLTLELVSRDNRELFGVKSISYIKWYSIRNSLKNMAWGNFQYIELELRNGRKVVIPSLIIDPAELSLLLSAFEVVRIKKIIPKI